MKAIMISIQPKWVKKILNVEKTIEVRKKFPADYVGWVYIYCTKDHKKGLHWNTKKWVCVNNNTDVLKEICFNGKVVARFWCNKVDYYDDIAYWSEENEKTTCLSPNDFFDYMFHIRCCRSCRFIHITKLEIFDEPKELSEFYKCEYIEDTKISDKERHFRPYIKITRAPQNWQYIEVFENE